MACTKCEHEKYCSLERPDELCEAIKEKAEELYEKSGEKPYHDLDNWLDAERIVHSQLCSYIDKPLHTLCPMQFGSSQIFYFG